MRKTGNDGPEARSGNFVWEYAKSYMTLMIKSIQTPDIEIRIGSVLMMFGPQISLPLHYCKRREREGITDTS